MRLSGFLSSSVFVAMMLSCTNLQENEVIPTGLTTDTQELLFSEASDMKSIVVVSGSRWSVDEKPSWLSIQSIDSQRYSEYEWTVNLASEANVGYDREGMLTILAGSEEVNISVEQEGKKGKYVAVESVSISPSTLTLTEGESSTLTYTISPSNASEKGVTWKSSSPSVATVSESGEVEALTVGTTTIMITTEDGGKTSSCAVTVKAKVIPVKSVSLDKTSITMTVGDTQTLIATVAPENATEKSVTWSSSNTSVATVSPYGVVTAKAAGTATIVVTTIDGSKKADCALTVKSKEIPVESISLDRTRLVMKLGESRTLTATVSPSSATEKGVTWTSDNSSVATVSTSGVVTAKGYGSATIRAKTIDGGYVADCSVEVYTPIQDLDISMPTKLTITEGEIEFLHVSINVDIEDVHIDPLLEHYSQWSVEDESIVSIDRENSSSLSALLKAISVGTTKVTNKLMDSFGSRTLSCLITVEKKAVPVTGVSLNKSSLSMTVGDTQTLTATVTPSNATDKSVTWTSSKTTVATVSSSGVVTAKAAGTATITVTTNDGSKTATCTVTVQAAKVSVTGVSLDKSSMIMEVGDIKALIASVTPPNATDKSVMWFSSNDSIATVTSDGVVTAKEVGTAAITVKTNDGGQTAVCTLTINEKTVPVTGISLDKTSLTLVEGGTYHFNVTITPENATNQEIWWSISNESIVNLFYDRGIVALDPGYATITVGTFDGDQKATCFITVTEAETINGHKFVDLGLPSGLKWASCNIGASNSTELGDKFAWGETSTKTSFSNYNYKWGYGETNDYTMTKYNSEDNRTILELQDDAANANWGGNWRIPTVDDVLELYNNCVIKNIRVNGVNGYIYISNINGNSLFIRSDSVILENFWTSSLATWNPEAARAFSHIYWKTGLVDDSVLDAVLRYCGLYVRPVSN